MIKCKGLKWTGHFMAPQLQSYDFTFTYQQAELKEYTDFPAMWAEAAKISPALGSKQTTSSN